MTNFKNKKPANSPVEIVAEYVSEDGKLKSVVRVNTVRQNRSSSIYEVDFYKDGSIIATESYAFHTLRYHEDAAENYVNGIKKIDESKVS